MKITKEQIKALRPCREAWHWYLEESSKSEDLEALLLETNKERADWAGWLFTNLMTQKQCVEISIFASEHVIPIFEAEYPGDNRPRKAIEAARAWLEDPTEENRSVAIIRSAAINVTVITAVSAVYATVSIISAARARANAYAATAYIATIRAVKDVAAPAYAEAEINALQIKIIKEAVRILERNN